MNKLAKNIFYGVSFGLSVMLTIWIISAGKTKVGMPVSFGLTLMYILMGLAVVSAVMLAVKNLINKPKSAILFGIGIGLLVILIAIGYMMDNHKVMSQYPKYGVSTETKSGIIGGSLIATWIILVGAVALTLYAALADFIKKL